MTMDITKEKIISAMLSWSEPYLPYKNLAILSIIVVSIPLLISLPVL